jgi:hypothetical protein
MADHWEVPDDVKPRLLSMLTSVALDETQATDVRVTAAQAIISAASINALSLRASSHDVGDVDEADGNR